MGKGEVRGKNEVKKEWCGRGKIRKWIGRQAMRYTD